ncbi:MAG: hypothetical protein KDE19_24090, partial [Caldilineaceae bacterium]|nr:hypothetical protein [Caldilineaceae bacterium]
SRQSSQGLKTPGYATAPDKAGLFADLSPIYQALFVVWRFIAGRIPSAHCATAHRKLGTDGC